MMVDMLPFPRITGATSEEKMSDIINYLIQFKETLEFALMNISTENLSPELVNQLNELGANIEKSNVDREEEVAQLSKFSSITVSDVCNSALFKNEIDNRISKITFNVNFDTGELEYSIQE